MILYVTFALLFVVGPLVFRQMLRMGLERKTLGLIAVVLMVAAIFTRPMIGESDEGLLQFAPLMLIWGAWIVVLVMGVMALRRAIPGRQAMRWTAVAGAAGTTVPWFGLASARWLAG